MRGVAGVGLGGCSGSNDLAVAESWQRQVQQCGDLFSESPACLIITLPIARTVYY